MMAHVHAPLALIDPEILLLAYRSGIFPMSDARDDPEVFWIEPRLRAILPLDQFPPVALARPHAEAWALPCHLQCRIREGDGPLRRAAHR